VTKASTRLKRKKKIEIIYDDDDIIVINKPAGISVTKDRGGGRELAGVLAEQLASKILGKLLLVHRLDKDTSGVMILAKNTAAQSTFLGYFARKQVKKTYLAIVAGIPAGQQGTINARLMHSKKNSATMCVTAKGGKGAFTDWKLLADFGSVALLAVVPLTGRTHQIRVHMASIGLPLAIDPLYGSSWPLLLSDFKTDYRLGKGKVERPLIDRLTLHAYQIQLLSLQSDRPDCFVAGLDKKFSAAIKMLTKYNPNGLDAFVDPADFFNIMNNKNL